MSEPRALYAITDHALLRWLERAHGIDVQFFRREMQREVEHSILSLGDEPNQDADAQFVIDGEAVVTVLEPGQRLKKQKRLGGYAVPRVPLSDGGGHE